MGSILKKIEAKTISIKNSQTELEKNKLEALEGHKAEQAYIKEQEALAPLEQAARQKVAELKSNMDSERRQGYYNLDAFYQRELMKELKKGSKKVGETERTVFDDEEQRRLELMREREKQKEEQVEALKRSMQSGLAQDMKHQALLREEMALQYKLGNYKAAAAIQRKLDPDVAMFNGSRKGQD